MKILRVLLALSPLLLGGWDHGAAVIPKYYWAASGNDANNCLSPATACQTITNFASFPFVAGDVVAFNGGDTFVGGLTITADNMTITTYGSGQPTISSGNSSACVTSTNHAGLVVNNIICTGGGVNSNTTEGILVINSGSSKLAGPTITNNTISGYGSSCIFVKNTGSTDTAGFTNPTINSNTTHDCTGNLANTQYNTGCIVVERDSNVTLPRNTFTNITINQNLVYNCPGTAGNTRGGGYGIFVKGGTTVTIGNNLVHDTGSAATATAGPVGIICLATDGCIIQNNEVYNITSAGGDGFGIDTDIGAVNSIVQYNYLHDNLRGDLVDGDFGVSPSNANNTIRYNLAQNIVIFPSTATTTGLKIYNNTIMQPGNSPCIKTSSGPPNSTAFTMNISNNICYNAGSFQASINFNLADNNGAVVTLTGNDYYGGAGGMGVTITISGTPTTYTTLASLQAAGYEKVGTSPTGTTANPNITSTSPTDPCGTATTVGWNASCPTAFQLTTSSPAGKGNGLNLFLIYLLGVGIGDFYGNPISVNNLPIGAAANK